MIVPSDAFTLIRREFDQQTEVAALFGSYDDNPGCTDFFSSFKNLFHHHVHQTSLAEAVTFWSGCGAIRRAAFEAVGGFNAALYPEPSIEDIELGFRLTQQQQRVRLVKDLQVQHLKKWTLTALLRADIFQRAVPWTQLISRTGYLPCALNLAWEARLSAGLVALAALLATGLAAALIDIVRWFSGEIAAVLLLVAATLLFLNRELYVFFWRKRGPIFALGAILAHWVYFFYSGATFLFCSAAELLRPATDSLVANPQFPPDAD